ncbi:MAG: hypothetical protein U9Q81_16570 [Pseudomonadota bacterium]|nr:hypothetical protein [Pseudomonadota bacterium]
MSHDRFDVLFAGELQAGEERDEVRRRLQSLFKLSDDAAIRLFSGRPVAIKREVDADTASRYRQTFLKAGALVHIVPTDAAAGPESAPDQAGRGTTAADPHRQVAESSGLALSPPGDQPLEPPVAANPPAIDIGHLGLVPGSDWTLEDCEPPLEPIELPDIGHLRILGPPIGDADDRQS